MIEAWTYFAVMILVQFLLFITFAYHEKKLNGAARILGRGVLIGIPLGLFFDLVLGKLLGLSSYVLGFGAFFLTVNATLSYGLFAATILLLKGKQLLRFCLWTVLVTLAYEVTNLFFHVWTWQFMLPPAQFVAVLLIGYLGGASVVVLLDRVFGQKRTR